MNAYLGIDLHKRSSAWVLIDESRKVLKELNVKCTPEEVNRSLTLLPLKPQEISAAVEPVCGWRWFTEVLEKQGMKVSIANPLKTRLIADSKLKNDRIDAKALAELLRADYLPTSYKAPQDIDDLRNTVRYRAYLVRMRTGIKNRIHAICTRNGLHFTTDNPLQKKGLSKLKGLGNEEIQNLLLIMEEIEHHIKKIEQKMSYPNDTIKLLMTMPGVGIVTGTSIYAEVGDFTRFKTPQALASYAGIVPSQRSSGQSIKMGHITRVGSKVLRYSIVEAAFRVRNGVKSQTLYNFYKNLVPRCGAKKARVALGRKMLTILWHMVKDNTPYSDPSLKSTQSVVISY